MLLAIFATPMKDNPVGIDKNDPFAKEINEMNSAGNYFTK
jgi:hypothetical protein